mgnify:FL=1
MISKKTWLVPLLTVVMLMSLCACGKSDNAKVCESLINKIGEVTLDSEKTIRVAEEAYDALTEEEKVQIKKSAEKLSESRDAYNQLLIDTKLGSVEELIDAIGEVTLDSEKAIINAEEAFNALSDEEKEIIKESGEKLEASRASYDTMLMEQHASSVISSIDAIGDVTLDAKSAIEGARTLYNALTSDEKAMVTNYNVLEMAEAELDTLVKEEKQKLLNEYLPKFNVSEDKVEGITWYMPKNTPQYINERCYVTAMVGVEGDKVWMCNRFNYTGDNWVFYNKIILSADGEKYEKDIGSFATTRDNSYGDVWEYYDEPLRINADMDLDEIQFMAKIAYAEEAIIRFKGDDYSYDYTVTSADKQAIRDAIELYRALLP